ncbi:hypothetical protein F4824DRAFT_500869 [Ustulina deusta]|nr:hypothetical protein F4823DRAFT_547487 [Ustulina deusta]KAI3335634.1 hypothetical protein F4824DRAFT_500869 [Ustulina deusta]
MEGLKQDIAEIDSAIIVARQWHKEAKTEQDAKDRQAKLDKLESDLVTQQAKLDAKILEEEMRKRQESKNVGVLGGLAMGGAVSSEVLIVG